MLKILLTKDAIAYKFCFSINNDFPIFCHSKYNHVWNKENCLKILFSLIYIQISIYSSFNSL